MSALPGGQGQPSQAAGLASLWSAPLAPGPLDARLSIPGSKSQTARYLLLAALAGGQSQLRGALTARDTSLLAAALTKLGCQITTSASHLTITPILRPDQADSPNQVRIDVGLAGTVMRFVPPLAALSSRPVFFDGDLAARSRPLAGLLAALTQLGARLTYHGAAGHLPLTIEGPLHGGAVKLDSRASSQFASALLLVAPALPGGLELQLDPAQVPSRPHLEMTEQALTCFGATWQALDDSRWLVQPGGLSGQNLTIEPDLSNAAPFLAAALVAGGQVTITNWPKTTNQPGRLLTGYLEQMGATVSHNTEKAELSVSGNQPIKGVDLDLTAAGELTPTLAALACLADGPSRLFGIGHLRGHETNRLAALTNEINHLGGQATELADGLEIKPKPLHATTIATYQDHRMATFGAIIGLKVPGTRVDNLTTTAKTMPTFPELWDTMLRGGSA